MEGLQGLPEVPQSFKGKKSFHWFINEAPVRGTEDRCYLNHGGEKAAERRTPLKSEYLTHVMPSARRKAFKDCEAITLKEKLCSEGIRPKYSFCFTHQGHPNHHLPNLPEAGPGCTGRGYQRTNLQPLFCAQPPLDP